MRARLRLEPFTELNLEPAAHGAPRVCVPVRGTGGGVLKVLCDHCIILQEVTASAHGDLGTVASEASDEASAAGHGNDNTSIRGASVPRCQFRGTTFLLAPAELNLETVPHALVPVMAP